MKKNTTKTFLVLMCLFIAVLMVFTSCNGTSNTQSGSNTDGNKASGDANKDPDKPVTPQKPDIDYSKDPTMDGIDTSFMKNFADMFTERDQSAEFDESKSAVINLSTSGIESSSKAVRISDNKAMLVEEGTYIVRGTLLDGMIIVNAAKTAKVQIVLDGVELSSSTSAPIYVMNADKVVITLKEGTENALSNGGSFVAIDENNIDAAIFSKDDLTINGKGFLRVTSPAGHGIVSNDDLVIAGGSYNINAAGHALDANDSIRLDSANGTFVSGKDGIHVENKDDSALGFLYVNSGEYIIDAKGDGISASADIQINNGKFDIEAGKGVVATDDPEAASTKGIRTDGNLIVNDGSFVLISNDDGFNVKKNAIFVAGSLDISVRDDAVHSDNALYSVNAQITVKKSYEGLEAAVVDIRGGKADIVADNDAINVAGGSDGTSADSFGSVDGNLFISGGDHVLKAGGDGLDVNGSFNMSGGKVLVYVSAADESEAFDYEGEGEISGGLFIAAGSASIASIPEAKGQGIISVNSGAQAANTKITVYGTGDMELISVRPELDFEVVIVCGPELVKGETYKVTVGDLSGSFVAK